MSENKAFSLRLCERKIRKVTNDFENVRKTYLIDSVRIRSIANLTVPGGQEFHFPHCLLKFRSIFLIFPQTLFIFFLILVLRVGESPTREGSGYATGSNASRQVNHPEGSISLYSFVFKH